MIGQNNWMLCSLQNSFSREKYNCFTFRFRSEHILTMCHALMHSLIMKYHLEWKQIFINWTRFFHTCMSVRFYSFFHLILLFLFDFFSHLDFCFHLGFFFC